MKLNMWLLGSLISSILLILATIVATTRGRRQQFPISDKFWSNRYRSSKLVPFFFIVRIFNEPCTSDSGVSGVCFTKSQCKENRGLESGKCASGFGVCCVKKSVTETCDSVITANGTNFVNRDYPAAFTPTGLEVCKTRIRKPTSNVCQIRLDFISFQLAGGDTTNGQCLTDNFSITGVSSAVPKNLCSNLAGQHMYLDYGSSSGITLNIVTDGVEASSRNWNIKIMYIECNSLARAPDGCLQFFPTAAGQVRMLGYPHSVPHLADLDYTVCVRSEDDSASIVWSPCKGDNITTVFFMTGPDRVMPDGETGAAPYTACNWDYVLIMTGNVGVPAPSDRYCGNVFASATPGMHPYMLQSSHKPFIMQVYTDAIEGANDVMNTGFCLAFRQLSSRS